MEGTEALVQGLFFRAEGSGVGEIFLGHHRRDGRIGTIMHIGIERGQFDGRMDGAGGSTAYKKGRREAFARHHLTKFFHSIERRSNQAAHTDNVGLHFARLGQNIFTGHHHAHIKDLESAALQHNGGDVLSNIVDIAANSRNHKARLADGCPVTAGLDRIRRRVR